MTYDKETHIWKNYTDNNNSTPKDGYLITCHMNNGDTKRIFIESKQTNSVIFCLNRMIENNKPIIFTDDFTAINLLNVSWFEF